MRTIFKIAKNELSTLFYSPVAWAVIIIFTCQTAVSFMDAMVVFKTNLDIGFRITYITANVVLGIFDSVEKNIYIYIPLLTMGLISREIGSGSIKLLYSSPIKVREIVFGKFVAMMGIALIFSFITLVFIVAACFSIESPDVKFIISGMIGLYLLICTYAAIGLFMSCLTSYQLVAAISTFAVLAAMTLISSLWQDVEFVRGITYYISVGNRAIKFFNGLISTKNLFYFFIMISVFLGFTIFKLQSDRETKSLAVNFRRYGLLIGCAFLLGYISTRNSLVGYWDMTDVGRLTVTKRTQEILKGIKDPVKVHTYVNVLDAGTFKDAAPQKRSENIDFYEPYQRFLSEDMQLGFTYFYDSIINDPLPRDTIPLSTKTEKIAEAEGLDFEKILPPDKIEKIQPIRAEENRFIRNWELNGKSAVTRIFYDMYPQPKEAEIMAAVNSFFVPHSRIASIVGHNERSVYKTGDRDFSDRLSSRPSRKSLINQGFDFVDISLDKQDIPKDVDAVIIADPTLPYTSEEIQKVRKYIADGGNIMLAAEPGKHSLIDSFVNQIGVHFIDGILLQSDTTYTPDFVIANFAPEAIRLSKVIEQIIKDTAHITTHKASGLTYDKNSAYKIDPFIISDEKTSWNRIGTVNLDSGKVTFNPAVGDVRKSYPIAVTATRQVGNKEQKIVVFGDADFLANGEFSGVPKKNWELTGELFSWFCGAKYPYAIERPESKDNNFHITDKQVSFMKVFLMGVMPGIFLLGGSVLLFKRKRK